MNHIESVNIGITPPSYIFIVGIILLTAFTIYYYRYTVPKIPQLFKIILIVARSLAIISLLLLIFEPILTINSTKIITPVNMLYIDNSKSMIFHDSTGATEAVSNFIKEFEIEFGQQNLVFTFGTEIDSLNENNSWELPFSGSLTNFSDITEHIRKSNNNIASIVIVSDGVVTDGASPIYDAERLGIPIYTIGIGDTVNRKDIEIKKVLYNEYLYAGQPSKIRATVLNKDLPGRKVTISLSENSILANQQSFILDESGQNEIEIPYTPQTPGDIKLSVEISFLEDEVTSANNKKTLFVTILKSKLNVLTLSGSPSSDLSFIKNSLGKDDNLSINSITQLSGNQFIEKENHSVLLDSADILFLIGFPSINTTNELILNVLNQIKEKRKPFFISLAAGTDLRKLTLLSEILPFSISNITDDVIQIQPEIIDFNNSLLIQAGSSNSISWNNLPPVQMNESKFEIKPGTDVIAAVKYRNVSVNSPLIISNRIASLKSIAILAGDIWRWKLRDEKEISLFDSFFNNSIKWLYTKDGQKQVSVRSVKKIYNLGEEIDFVAQIYSETFNPIVNAEVLVKIIGRQRNAEIELLPGEDNFYYGSIASLEAGEYEYESSAILNNRTLGTTKGKFSIEQIDVENLNPSLNKDFLSLLSTLTNGKYYYINNHSKLKDKINKNLTTRETEITFTDEYILWSEEIFLVWLILLLTFEWLIRKNAGMI